MDFYEQGVQGYGLEGQEGGIEAFDMADLELDIGLADQLDELAGLFHRAGEGFFDEYVFALTDGFFTEFKMERGGGYDVDEKASMS
jgi:hypothetical protein